MVQKVGNRLHTCHGEVMGKLVKWNLALVQFCLEEQLAQLELRAVVAPCIELKAVCPTNQLIRTNTVMQ